MDPPVGPSEAETTTAEDVIGGRLTTRNVEYLDSKDNGLLKEIKTELKALRELVKRVKVEGVKESVDRTIKLFTTISANRPELKLLRSHSKQQQSADLSG